MKKILILLLLFNVKSVAQKDAEIVFTSVEQAVVNPAVVKSLDLSGQNLRYLPLEIDLLYNLEKIDLSANPNLDLQQAFQLLSALKQLKTLDLSKDSLTSVPLNISSLTNLEDISLDYNNLIECPLGIKHLSKLKYLTLFVNKISKLKLKPGELPNLVYINLCYNRFKRFPVELAVLKNLKRVTIWYNKISYIPPSTKELTNIEAINLQHNKLKKLPGQLSGLKNLKELNLRDNFLTENNLQPVYKMYALTDLNLQGNKISAISPAIANLKNLVYFSVCDNPLTELPTELSQLKMLEQLGLGDLHNLNWGNAFLIMAKLPNLKRVGMYTMQLKSMPGGFEKLQQVTTFWLTFNSFNYTEQNRIKAMVPNAEIDFH